MSISKLPSGRWRAQVYDPSTGKTVSVPKIIGGPSSYATKREAKAAREKARATLRGARGNVTVAQWRDRWLNDPLFRRPKESTMVHNAERTKAFADRYGSLPLSRVTSEIVAEWLAAGHAGTVPALRAMFNDAMSVKAGRLIDANPFARLGLERSRGNRDNRPPTEEQVWAMIEHARRLTTPFFAAWLQVACFTGMRPGELDGLRWEDVDFDRYRIRVERQWNRHTRTFTLPKNGRRREAILTPPARDALLALPRQSECCFVSSRGRHFTPSSRDYYWRSVKAAAGWDRSLYLATRHFAGSYMINVLGLDSEDVAIALGHEDGGELVRKLYGHRDRELALLRVQHAFEQAANVRPLRASDGRQAV